MNINTENEVWKDVLGYEDQYQVSCLGRVRSKDREVPHKNGSVRRIPGIIRKTPIDRYGYPSIRLSKDGETKSCNVHTLVAIAFVPNPKGNPQVNHIDEVKTNNHYKNLEWVTIQENSIHGTRINRIQKVKSKQGREVIVIDTELNEKHKFVSIRQAGSSLGISSYSIYKNLNSDKLIKNRYIIKRRG